MSIRFKFNLLPKETFLKRLELRDKLDKITLGASVLPLAGVLIWIILFGANFSLRSEVTKRTNIRDTVEVNIAGYEEIRVERALLLLKMGMLADIIDKDINPEVFFGLVENIIYNSGIDVEVLSYGRSQDGKFKIGLGASSVEEIGILTGIFREDLQIEGLELNKVSFEENDEDGYEFELIFNLNIIDIDYDS